MRSPNPNGDNPPSQVFLEGFAHIHIHFYYKTRPAVHFRVMPGETANLPSNPCDTEADKSLDPGVLSNIIAFGCVVAVVAQLSHHDNLLSLFLAAMAEDGKRLQSSL